jgi:hypothetical protein
MLTNTVGIKVFILIFTVLTAGGVVIAKRLPLERSTAARPLTVVCAGGRILPINEGLIDQFLKPLGRPSWDAIDGWIERYNAQRIEDEYFIVKGEGKANYWGLGVSLDLAVMFTPREGKGETSADLRLAGSGFRQFLGGHQPKDRFIYFLVQPDSLDAFAAARAVAVEMNFATGWSPQRDKEPVGFCITRGCGGRIATIQTGGGG